MFYPHLRETVERVQVERVLRRQHAFLRLMHERFGDPSGDRTIDLMREATRTHEPLEPVTEPLKTAFQVRPEMLAGNPRPLAVDLAFAEALKARFERLRDALCAALGPICWEAVPPPGALLATRQMGDRMQPFTLLLTSSHGLPLVRCLSPIGVIEDTDAEMEGLLRRVSSHPVRLCANRDVKLESYNLSIEGDVLLDATGGSDAQRVSWLVDHVTKAADDAERELLGQDQPMTFHRQQLTAEADYAR